MGTVQGTGAHHVVHLEEFTIHMIDDLMKLKKISTVLYRNHATRRSNHSSVMITVRSKSKIKLSLYQAVKAHRVVSL
jgi:hypothetical protein